MDGSRSQLFAGGDGEEESWVSFFSYFLKISFISYTMATAFSLKTFFFTQQKYRFKKIKWLWPARGEGWKIKTLWPPILGEKSEIIQHRKPLWPKRKNAQKRSPKRPPLNKNRPKCSQAIFRKRSHAWATDVLKILEAPMSQSILDKARIAFLTKKSFAPRQPCILAIFEKR